MNYTPCNPSVNLRPNRLAALIAYLLIFLFTCAPDPSGIIAMRYQAVGAFILGTPPADNTAVTYTVRYTSITPIDDVNVFSVWADTQTPLGYRLNDSLHARLKRIDTNTFQLLGEQLSKRTAQCGARLDPVYCYQNYDWDVEPATGKTITLSAEGHPGNPTGYLYMNHDYRRFDSAAATDSTIGRIRALSVVRISANTLDIAWEFSFGPFFRNRELNLYQYMAPVIESYGSSPTWRHIGTLIADSRTPQEVVYADGFENGSGSQSSRVYRGQAALAISHGYTQRALPLSPVGIFRIYFYDDATNTSDSTGVGISDTPVVNGQPRLWIGVYPPSSHYVYKSRIEDAAGNELTAFAASDLVDTGVVRTSGWKEVTFYVSALGAWAEITDAARAIHSVSMTQLGSRYVAADRKFVPLHVNLTGVNYLHLGAFGNDVPSGTQYFDELTQVTLPEPPTSSTLTTPAGALAWNDKYAAIFLDHYEDILSGGNLEQWTGYATSPAGSREYRNSGAWNATLHILSLALSTRYKATGLLMYKTQLNRVLSISLNPNVGTYLLTSYALLNEPLRSQIVGEALTLADRALRNEPNTSPPPNSFPEENSGIGNSHIGDSHAENYSAFGAQFNALSAYMLTASESYKDLSLRLARKTLSTSVAETYQKWPGVALGVKNIYAHNENPSDCLSAFDATPDCLCRGDRAAFPSNRDFSYLVDNHDYSPHPTYQIGAVMGPLSAIAILKLSGLTAEPDYYANLAPTTMRLYDFIDYQRQNYRAASIFRIRNKHLCDDSADNSTPYDQSANVFRQDGLDDWGSTPDINPGLFALLVYDFAGTSYCPAPGCHIEPATATNLFELNTRFFYHAHHNFIGQADEPNVYFVEDDFKVAGAASRIVSASARNSIVRALNRLGFYDPVPFPVVTLSPSPVSAGKLVTVSSGASAAAVVDGDLNSTWDSGAGAPQAVEIDLGAEYMVSLIKLHAEQSQSEMSTHEIQVAGAGHVFTTARSISRWTSSTTVLNAFFSTPLPGVRYVKVVTIQSPSSVAWREIEVFTPKAAR